MKKVLMAVLMVASVNAFAGYTAELCDIDEGTHEQKNCRMVYFDRNLGEPSKYNAPVFPCGDSEGQVSCAKEGKVPQILINLSQWFLDNGFTPAPTYEIPGGAGQ